MLSNSTTKRSLLACVFPLPTSFHVPAVTYNGGGRGRGLDSGKEGYYAESNPRRIRGGAVGHRCFRNSPDNYTTERSAGQTDIAGIRETDVHHVLRGMPWSGW